jgi:P4 family phage/plasmid primase-like protien
MTKGVTARMPGDTGDHIDHDKFSMVDTDASGKSNENMTVILDTLGHDYTFKTPEDIEVLYLYRDGIYVPGETTVKGRVEEILNDKTKSHFCYEVVEHFKRRSYVPRETFNSFQGFIPVQNGLLDLETLRLVPHDRNKIFTFKIGTKFNLSSECPKFKAFLNAVLPIPDEQLLLQEYAGYTLLPGFPHHKFMVCVGGGRNGKGSFIRTLEGILGNQSTTSVRLEQLDGTHRFAVARLYGSLMNVCSEPSTKYPFPTELLKQICGQDTLDAELKNKQNALRFTSFAKFFIQANHLPVINDTTLSFWDRVLILEFKQTFTDEKGNRIGDIEKTWLDDEDERAGILNWMLEGLKRLNENNRFTHTKSQDEMILIFKQASDPIGAFLTDPKHCIYGLNLWTVRQDLYNRYKEYAETLGLEIKSDKRFAERVRRLAGVADRQKRVEGRKERVWKGIGLVPKAPESDVPDFDIDMTLPEFGVAASGTCGTRGTRPLSPVKSAGDSNHSETGESIAHAPSAPSVPAEAKALNEEVIFGVMNGRSWTWTGLSDELVRLGYSRDEFQVIFRELAEDPRIKSSGSSPVYYHLQDVVE